MESFCVVQVCIGSCKRNNFDDAIFLFAWSLASHVFRIVNLRVSVEPVDIAVVSNVSFVFDFFLEESFNKKSSNFYLSSAVIPLDGNVLKAVARETVYPASLSKKDDCWHEQRWYVFSFPFFAFYGSKNTKLWLQARVTLQQKLLISHLRHKKWIQYCRYVYYRLGRTGCKNNYINNHALYLHCTTMQHSMWKAVRGKTVYMLFDCFCKEQHL